MILREDSRVSSLMLRTKLWLANKVLHYGDRFAGALLTDSGIPLTIRIQNPSASDKDWHPVPGIRNPRRGIQNPRLFWTRLHGAIVNWISEQRAQGEKQQITNQKSEILYRHEDWNIIIFTQKNNKKLEVSIFKVCTIRGLNTHNAT